MITRIHHRRGEGFGKLLAGMVLIELGLLQFFQVQFGIEWAQMWPLFLLIPGVALVLRPRRGDKNDKKPANNAPGRRPES